MVVFRAFGLALLVLILVGTGGAEVYDYANDRVYIDNAKAYVSASPITKAGPGYVNIDILSKQWTGQANVGFCFNSDWVKPVRLEYYNPTTYWNQAENVSWVENWVTYQGQVTKLNVDFGAQNRCFVVRDVPVTAGETINARVLLEMPVLWGDATHHDYEGYSPKYDVAIWPSSYPFTKAGVRSAYQTGNLFLLDPAVNLTTGLQAYFGLNTGSGAIAVDETGNDNGTITGATWAGNGILGNQSLDFDGSGDEVSSVYNIPAFADFSISGWMNTDDSADEPLYGTQTATGAGGSDPFVWLYMNHNFDPKGFAFDIRENGGGTRTTLLGNATWSNSTWIHIVATYDHSPSKTMKLYQDGVLVGEATYAGGTWSNANTPFIGIRWGGAKVSPDARIDEVALYNTVLNQSQVTELYNSGDGCSPIDNPSGCTAGGPPAAGTASERLEQVSTLAQSGSATLSSASFSTLISENLEVTSTSALFTTASIPITSITQDNTAECKTIIDGEHYDTVQTRSNTAGNDGHLSLMSNVPTLSSANYTVALQCRRSSGQGSYTVEGATITVVELQTSDGINLVWNNSNNTQAASNSVPLLDFDITTSENATDTGFKRFLIADWTAEPTYSSAGNVTYTVEIAGSNCTPVKRYGSSGTGSAGGICTREAPTNSTVYDLKLWATAPGVSVSTHGHMNVREVIAHTPEVKNASTAASVTSTALTHIVNVTVTPNGLHSAGSIRARAGISAHADNNDTVNLTFKLVSDTNNTLVTRTVNLRQPGVVTLEHLLTGISSATTIGLWASCDLNNCTINGGDLVAYFADTEATTPNTFIVNATDQYTGQKINTFSTNLSDTTFSTTTGTITLIAIASLVNLTTPGSIDKDGGLAYFTINTGNHDTTTNLSVTLRPYTLIKAQTQGGSPFSNFSINYTDKGTNATYGPFVTTTGSVYIPLFNSTYNVTVFNAPNAAKQTGDIDATGSYWQNYTFNLTVSDTFNITLYNETTNSQVTQNATLELISDSFSKNYSLPAGYREITGLANGDYTLRYWIDADVPREYYVTLAAQSYETISLYQIDEEISSLYVAIVRDENGQAVADATVKLLRYYILTDNTGEYRTVEMSKTDTNGQAVFRVQPNIINYKFLIEKGAFSFTTSPSKLTSATDTFTLRTTASPLTSIDGMEGVSRSLIFNTATNTFTFTWSDTSNLVTEGCLKVQKVKNRATTEVMNTCTASASGSLIYTVTDTNQTSYTAKSTIKTNTEYSEYFDTISYEYVRAFVNFGLIGVFLAFIVFLVAAFMGLGSTEGTVISGIGAIFLMMTFGFLWGNWTVMVGIIILGVIIVYKTRTS